MQGGCLTCSWRAGAQGMCSRSASSSASTCHTMPKRRASGRAALANMSQTVQRVSGSLKAATETNIVPDVAATPPGWRGSGGVSWGGGAAENHTVSAYLRSQQAKHKTL